MLGSVRRWIRCIHLLYICWHRRCPSPPLRLVRVLACALSSPVSHRQDRQGSVQDADEDGRTASILYVKRVFFFFLNGSSAHRLDTVGGGSKRTGRRSHVTTCIRRKQKVQQMNKMRSGAQTRRRRGRGATKKVCCDRKGKHKKSAARGNG